jgi:assimilatory nitrate reductase catalytic subunit
MSSEVRTTCPYCGVGCGVVARVDDDGAVTVKGDPQHPANFGRLCSKGAALAETLDLEGRLLHPEVDGQRTDWDGALAAVSERFGRVIAEHGPDAVAFYVSGQLLTEDYYVANKLMKGFIGSANIDTNSRLCMSSAVAAHKRAFGSDTVPLCYEDLEQADLVVLTGSNLAWCHPVLYQRLLVAKKRRPQLRVVVIDPRRTASCDIADLHLPLRSGSDAVLFNGLLAWLDARGAMDASFVQQHTEGLAEALRIAAWYAPSPAAVAQHCDLDEADVLRLYQWFTATPKVVTVFSQGINQSSSGTDKGNAIINCHLFTGRIGKPGAGPFSMTGQPNAMGGREVGGLANQLAAHMELGDEQHRELVQRFWQSPRIAAADGLKAVDLFRAIERGEVKALWVMATNPAVSLPDTNQVRRALARCDCLVVSDCVADTDTSRYAHIKLPALAWGEKDGTVTNSERCISRQRPFLPAPGEARADWWIVCQVAQRLGHAGFDYQTPGQVFDEHARLSGFENGGERDFDIAGLQGLTETDYHALQPLQWPVSATGESRVRLFGDGRFYTASGRARFVAVTPRPPAGSADETYDLLLNTGRVRDHWHTMTRTGKSPRLCGHVTEPYLALHPHDAETRGIEDGQLVNVSSAWGEVILRARVIDSQPRGQVFAPMHWNDQFASAARVGSMINPAVDPVSGQPEFKHTPVRAVSYQARWHGFVLTRRPVLPGHASYWSKARRQGLWHYEIAGEQRPDDWAAYARALLCTEEPGAEWNELFDSTQASYRAARVLDGQLAAVIFIGPDHRLPPRDWLVQLFKEPRLDAVTRGRLLAGIPPRGQQDVGQVVCACFNVGMNTIVQAIHEHGLDSAEAVGELLNAGTNCGSCVPELKRLIAEARVKRAS